MVEVRSDGGSGVPGWRGEYLCGASKKACRMG